MSIVNFRMESSLLVYEDKPDPDKENIPINSLVYKKVMELVSKAHEVTTGQYGPFIAISIHNLKFFFFYLYSLCSLNIVVAVNIQYPPSQYSEVSLNVVLLLIG